MDLSGTRSRGLQVRGRKEDEFLPQDVELLLGRTGFEQSPADSAHCPLQHRSYECRVFREHLAGGGQHCNNGLIGPYTHLLRDLRSVHVGAYGVESDTGFGIPHLGIEECVDESCRHVLERLPFLLPADSFHRLRNFVEVTFQDGLQERALVGEVLIQGSDRDTGSQCHPGRGQPFLPHAGAKPEQLRREWRPRWQPNGLEPAICGAPRAHANAAANANS